MIEGVHSRGFIHRDVKPEHFLLGIGALSDKVNIVDFGLAKQYRDPRTYLHIPYKEDKTLVGNVRYCSINTHLGIEQSRRDDLEALAYILIHFLRGSLPWDHLGTAARNYRRILEKKRTTSIDTLCHGLPSEFGTFLNYARSLQFNEKPDYLHIRELFRNLCVREGYQYDSVFDWSAMGRDVQDDDTHVEAASYGYKAVRKIKDSRVSDRRYV